MQFHHYRNTKNQVIWIAENNPEIDRRTQAKLIKSLTAAQFRQRELERLERKSSAGNEQVRFDCDREAVILRSEEVWAAEERPYYNVWPIAIELARSVRLDLPFAKLSLPSSTLVLRFPVGKEPHALAVALLCFHPYPDYEAMLHLTAYGGNSAIQQSRSSAIQQSRSVSYLVESKSRVQDFLEHLLVQKIEYGDLDGSSREQVMASQLHNEWNEASELLVRLTAFIGLLAGGRDIVTPVILSKDRKKYEQTDDPNARRRMEDRAARRTGRGFDLGRKLDEERAVSVHWRNPHPCLFWTGKGRDTPIIKIRRGGVVSASLMAEVPTGYLGPEPNAQLNTDLVVTP